MRVPGELPDLWNPRELIQIDSFFKMGKGKVT